MNYELLCNSVLGASHISKNIPCEDFGLKTDCGDMKIFVTADGHGDPNCMRSHIGSKFACEIAAKYLEMFARGIVAEEREWELFDERFASKRLRHLSRCIVNRWVQRVREHFSMNSPTNEDYSKAAKFADEFKNGIRVERAYGTTMMAGIQTQGFLLLLHQGDGRIVVFDENGKASTPVPWDDRCVGNATTSMCDPDAASSMRFYVINLINNPIVACFAGSDGVEDSFSSMEKVYAYYREFISYSCDKGVLALESYLGDELSRLSKEASQDDVTVTGIIDTERCKPFLEAFKVENRYIELQSDYDKVENDINSIETGGKYYHLQKKLSEAQEAFYRLEGEYNRLESECAELESVIRLQISDDNLRVALDNIVESAFNSACSFGTENVQNYLADSADNYNCDSTVKDSQTDIQETDDSEVDPFFEGCSEELQEMDDYNGNDAISYGNNGENIEADADYANYPVGDVSQNCENSVDAFDDARTVSEESLVFKRTLVGYLTDFIRSKFGCPANVLDGARQRYEKKLAEKNRVLQELNLAKTALENAKNEFEPYNNRYQGLKKQREAIALQLKEFKGE